MSVRKREWTTAKGETREAWIVNYTDGQGKRRLQTFERKKEAEGYEATVKVEVRKGTHVAPSQSPTVAEAAQRWLDRVAANGMNGEGPAERSTITHYRQHVFLHITPRIGNVKLSDLNPDRVGALRNDLLAKLSRPLARKVLISFKSILKAAGYSHVAADVSIGVDKRKRKLEVGMDIPTTAEVARTLAAASNPKQRALIMLLAFTGLRASELRGLRWKDIDFGSCELHVRQRADEYGQIGSPKSSAGVRTIPIDPDVMVPALREWKIQSRPGELVFATSSGKPTEYKSLMEYSFEPILMAAHVVDANGAPKYAPHAFRHFFASWCINPVSAGGRELPAKNVQALLGHSNIAMTLNVYGHLFPASSDRTELSASLRKLLA